MNKRRSQLFLAHPSSEEDPYHRNADNYVADVRPEDAAEYIAGLLSSLRAIAVQAQFRLLSDLLSVAEEEAKLHYRT